MVGFPASFSMMVRNCASGVIAMADLSSSPGSGVQGNASESLSDGGDGELPGLDIGEFVMVVPRCRGGGGHVRR